MFEQDYIMRQIREMIQVIFKFLFGIEAETLLSEFTTMELQRSEMLETKEEKDILEKMLDMTDKGNINEAENLLFELLDNNKGSLKTALLFYSALNDKTDDFLENNGFSREEIKQGLFQVMDRYDISPAARVILSDL